MRAGARLLAASALLLGATLLRAAPASTTGAAGESSAGSADPRHRPWTRSSQAGATVPAGAAGADTPAGASPDYVGSARCQPCHDADYRQWQQSLHIRMTKPITEATVVGDFTEGTRLRAHGRAYEFGERDGRPWVRVAAGEAAAETFPVDYTLGSKRYQGYLSRLPDGRIYVLPVFWHLASRRWLDWKETTPIPEGAHDLKQIWNINCFNCHATNLVQGFDARTKTYATTWTEMGIGCEMCHGAGRTHVTRMLAWRRDPTLRAGLDTSAANPQRSELLGIFAPKGAPPRQVFDTCAYCHGNKRNVFTGFQGGREYADHALPFLLSEPLPAFDTQGEFWPDGRPNRFNRPQALMQSGCFQAGAIACTNCHVAHGSRNDFNLKLDIHDGRTGDRLCTQCHVSPTVGAPGVAPERPSLAAARTTDTDVRVRRVASRRPDDASLATPWPDADIEAHTHHPAASEGSRCIGCHMSDVNWRMLVRRRDHTFRPPVPEVTASQGIPNACTTCHDAQTPEWAAATMDQWWGDADRRRDVTALAGTFYRAGAGDLTVAPALAAIAVDRRRSVFHRASAAEYLARLAVGGAGGASVQSQSSYAGEGGVVGQAAPRSGPRLTLDAALVNSLIAAAADPEPVVRATAVAALGTLPEAGRARMPIVARLQDESRIVRARAAEALSHWGIVTLPAPAGAVLLRAQQDFLQSMADFPDTPGNHASAAWMLMEMGRLEEARAEIALGLSLDQRLVRAIVLRGVLDARDGKYDEAIAAWTRARAIEPAYPNLDRLIEEARKRKNPARSSPPGLR